MNCGFFVGVLLMVLLLGGCGGFGYFVIILLVDLI